MLELSVGVILTDNDVFGSWVFAVGLFELAEKVNVIRNGLSDKFSNLVGHKSST